MFFLIRVKNYFFLFFEEKSTLHDMTVSIEMQKGKIESKRKSTKYIITTLKRNYKICFLCFLGMLLAF